MLFGVSNDFNLHSFVEANAVSGETVGAGPFGTVVVGDLPAGPFTQIRFLDTRRHVNFAPLTVFVAPTFEQAAAAAFAFDELVASGIDSATRVATRNRFIERD